MARQVLENGVVLPAEYSDDWYDDMTSNLTKLDDVIGSDSEKLSSADVGAAALSNNYNDLDNKPTIPTVNDATLTIQKNGVDVQTFTANASSNVTANITVPTKTSDLTNDSNFVDTSNAAVSSGITSDKVTDYDTHIADTDIHVTTADKDRWNNNTYVFRYSSTALTDSSTNSNALLDNTDNLKVGDKVIDSSGVLFSITAIDTANSTFTIGTALVDLAQDSDVVHKSGEETVGGTKTFENNTMVVGRNTDVGSAIQLINSDVVGDSANGSSGFEVYGSSISDANKIGSITIGEFSNNGGSYATIECNRTVSGVKSSNTIRSLIRPNGSKELSATVDNDCKLGTDFLRWSKVYAVNYYYGNDNVEFSTKFVTTDTAQTVSGAKTFSEDVVIGNSDTTQSSKRLVLRSYKASLSGSNSDNWGINFNAGASYAVAINAHKSTDGAQGLTYTVRTQDSNNNIFASSYRFRVFIDGNSVLEPDVDNNVSLGRSTNRWSDVKTYKVNTLEPSSLSLPSGNANDVIDISSYLTYLDGTDNTYVAPANGWITINMNNCSGIQAYINGLWGNQIVRPSAGAVRFLMPVLKNQTVNILISGGTIDNARFIPCQGNV